MSNQNFSASQREAIWLAYGKKCAYTRESIDVSDFHIDHIIPERLAASFSELEGVKAKLGLPFDFDIFGYGNLVPCRPGANLQKGSILFDITPAHYFLGIAANKSATVIENLARIEKRTIRGKALILLQQCLERGDLSVLEVAAILEDHQDRPEEIFILLEGMKFADSTEVHTVIKADIGALRDRPIRLGQNDHIDGVTLTNDKDQQVYVRTCREYDEAIKAGFYAFSNFDLKMATFFRHQCGLLTALEAATTPQISFITNPRVGIIDLELMPFSLFPQMYKETSEDNISATYQSKVSDGSIVVKKLRQNLLQISEPEGMGHQLVEVARADFNGDGIEDILLFEYCWATHGTLGFGGLRILTRKSADGLFESVSLNAPNE